MFKRKISFLQNKLLNIQYDKLVNEQNIETISKYKIWKIFKKEEFSVINIYFHNVIYKWILNQSIQDEKFYRNLKKIIKKTNIELNEVEKYELLLVEERTFSIYRHIKDIDVNVKLAQKEKVGAKFVNAKVYKKNHRKLSLVSSGNLLISNKRIILEKTQNDNFVFSFKDIVFFSFLNYGFLIQTKKRITYVIRIHDQITLNNTIKNILHKKDPKILEKELLSSTTN